MAEYKIGTSYAGMTYFSALTIPTADPRGDPMEYSNVVEIGNGTRKNLGWLRQMWHWDFLTEAQTSQLRAFLGSVYVTTRKNDGTFGVYTATLVWPEEEPEHYANRVLDITIELRKLVVYTP